ncbi:MULTISPECIES: hypothetical protein [Acinetobacter]|uniref:hypothetical protein n=1 Tax=Acinetobacter TaxID=469 RepID=UPI000C640D2B|nr:MULTISPECIES: hypothetical protein [unclassified Acinetobacter]MBC69742.1 hypothetical protein [Acinetobacter sp.]|tara:strand:- start:583 stop:1485 length:903 start_codon:yes stop_codon:yes gene_type:complete
MPDIENSNQYCFQLGQLNVDAQEDGKKKRTFSGVAYSGEVITDHWYWKQVIFDLDSMQIKGRIPALLEHSSYQRAGAIESHSISHESGLTVSGILLSNEFGTQVATDSDDGFPWQMSVRIEPASIDEIQAGNTVTVNGKLLHGPITVFRGGRIREVSFCALGADENTMAVAASHNPNNPQEDTDVTELEQAKDALQQAETERDNALNELKQFKANKRNDDISALEKELKTQFSVEDKTAYTAMDDASFSFTVKQLRQFSGKNSPANNGPSNLFTHQAKSDENEKQTFGAGSLVDQAKQRK